MRIKKFLANLWKNAIQHKISAALVLFAVFYGGYYAYGKFTAGTAQTRYVLAAAQKGTLIISVDGTGQVSVSNQLDIKPKVSGDVTSVAVAEGVRVGAGDLILRMDSANAAKAVRDAQANFDSAKIALQKLKQPADALSIIQAKNAVTQAKQSKRNAEDNLAKAYDDGFNAVSNGFIDLPGIMTGLNAILNGTALNPAQGNIYAYYDMIKTNAPNADQFRDQALASYATALTLYAKNLEDYKSATRYSSTSTIDGLINETYDAARSVSETIKDIKNFLDLVNDTLTKTVNGKAPSILSTHQSSMQSYTATVNGDLGNLLNVKNTIKNNTDAIVNGEESIVEKSAAQAKLKAGPDPLDIQSQELSLTQRENALLDTEQTVADYVIRAPFAGVVAKLNVKKGDPASPGSAVATVITDQRIAQISLNEVDVAKVQVGQKATLTFDAFPDLTIAGSVAEIDAIGTVTQGVVTYAVKIGFDTQDARVKPGMSVSASIITKVIQDVLLVPNAAVKTQGGTHSVQIAGMQPGAANATSSVMETGGNQGIPLAVLPQARPVEIGASNNSMTEITSGLAEGDLVVSRTITATSQNPAAQTPPGGGGFRIPGLGGRG